MAENCFPTYLCDSVGREGFSCDNDNCAQYLPYIRQQLYAGAGIMYSNADDASRVVGDRKMATANSINADGK